MPKVPTLGDLKNQKTRNAALLLELGVWLHLLGKYSSQFFRDQLSGNGKAYQSFYKNHPRLQTIFESTSWPKGDWKIHKQKIKGFQEPDNFAQFSKEHANQKFGKGDHSISLLSLAHGRASGTDKSVQSKGAYSQQQLPIHIATCFGYETPIDDSALDKKRDMLIQFLVDELDDLKDPSTQTQIDHERRTIIQELEDNLSISVSDTRRPINDVTLWDQTTASVAFFKPSLARNIFNGKWTSTLASGSNRYKWCPLILSLNGFQWWNQSNRIGDLLERQMIIRRVFRKIQKELEKTYPLSQKIYRDEDCIAFLLPGDPDWNDNDILNSVDSATGRNLRQILTEIPEDKKRTANSPYELALGIGPEDEDDRKPSRNMYILGHALSARDDALHHNANQVREDWKDYDNNRKPLCEVCGLRYQGFGKNHSPNMQAKAADRHQCCICMERLANRSKEWYNKGSIGTTVWLDEVADINGRLALIVGEFDIAPWLDGSLISTMTIPNLIDVDGQGHTTQDLDADLLNFTQGKDVDDGSLVTLPHYIDANVKRDLRTEKDFIKHLIKDEDLDRFSGIADQDLLRLALIRKPPSFARLMRVWRTTRTFWQECLPTATDRSISGSAIGSAIGTIGPRLKISGECNRTIPNDRLGLYHAYVLTCNRFEINVVWIPLQHDNEGFFIVIDNPVYLASQILDRTAYNSKLDPKVEANARTIITEFIQQAAMVEVHQPAHYGRPGKKVCALTQIKVGLLENSTYTPAIPILAEPRRFMALVPADKALDIAAIISKKYQREMGKVRNRLPFTLGVVYAHRHTPLRTIMDAGKRMLERKLDNKYVEGWTAKPLLTNPESHNDPHFQECWQIQLEKDGRTTTWHVPLTMGDGKTDDEWYPYVFVEEDKNGDPPTGRHRLFQAPCPWNDDELTWVLHAKELEDGDMVYFTPATFDYEFLDATGRRFEIAYDEQGRRFGDRDHRPYHIETLSTLNRIWGTFRGHLATTQIHALVETIETKREEWRIMNRYERKTPFWQLCRDLLANAEWRPDQNEYPWGPDKSPSSDWLDTWADFATRGWLADSAELHLKIMKERPDREQ